MAPPIEKRYNRAESPPSISDYEGTDLDCSDAAFHTTSEDDAGSLNDFVVPDEEMCSNPDAADGHESIIHMECQPKAILGERWVQELGEESQVQYQVLWISWVTPDDTPLQGLIDDYEARLRDE